MFQPKQNPNNLLVVHTARTEDKEWKELHAKESTTGRYCDHCECTVHDTTGMTDDELVNLLQADPKACLAISPTQSNCTVIP